jgi:hypothetical protein
MKEWLTDYMVNLLTEHENKLAEILGVLTFFQCITFLFMSFLGMSVQDAHSKLRKIEDRNEL